MYRVEEGAVRDGAVCCTRTCIIAIPSACVYLRKVHILELASDYRRSLVR
jgi:hypothetical protein